MTAEDLTNESLIQILGQELEKFSEDYFPLHKSQLKAIQRCTVLVDEDEDKILKNVPKKRAHVILKDLWTHIPEAFLLCSLAAAPTKIGTLKSADYMTVVLRWWKDVSVPHGLTKTLDSHSDVLPKVFRDSREVLVSTSLDELLRFLQRTFNGVPLQLSLPYSGSPLPYVRVGQAKLELSYELANAFIRQQQEDRGS